MWVLVMLLAVWGACGSVPPVTGPNKGVRCMKEQGDYLYVMYTEVLHIFRANDTTSPVGGVSIHEGWWVDVAGDLAFVSGSVGLVAVDVSDPRRPRLVAEYFVDSWQTAFRRVAVSDGNVYFLAENTCLAGLPIGSPSGSVAKCHPVVGSNNLAVQGGYAYVSGGNRLTIVDVRTWTTVSTTTSQSLPFIGDGVLVHGDTCYVSGKRKIAVMQVADRANPTLLSTIFTTGDTIHLNLVGDRLYAVDTNNWWVLEFDVADPRAPRQVGGRCMKGTQCLLATDRVLYFGGGPEVTRVTNCTVMESIQNQTCESLSRAPCNAKDDSDERSTELVVVVLVVLAAVLTGATVAYAYVTFKRRREPEREVEMVETVADGPDTYWGNDVCHVPVQGIPIPPKDC